MYNNEYLVEIEHEVIENNMIVEASISYYNQLGPENESEAVKFFKKRGNGEIPNLYGAIYRSTVRAVYKRVKED